MKKCADGDKNSILDPPKNERVSAPASYHLDHRATGTESEVTLKLYVGNMRVRIVIGFSDTNFNLSRPILSLFLVF
jgi:hypothetical protein